MTNLPTGTVTFLLTDLEGSTRLWEQNPAAMKKALAWHDEVVRAAIESNGGYIFTTAGDAFAAAFADPMQAAAAAVEAQEVISSKEWGDIGVLRVRMAIDTGIAEERGGDYFGPPVNRASRIMTLAGGGEILASHTAADLLKHHLDEGIRIARLGERQLKDVADPEIIFNVEFGPTAPPPVSPPPRRRMLLGITGLGLLVVVVAALLLVVRPFSGPETGSLTGADAAYADWIDEGIGSCSTNLFIGFVEAAGLQLPSESDPQPHSDLQAILTVNCPETAWNLEGVIQAADCVPSPGIASLESASVKCDLTIDSENGARADLEIDLRWNATGAVLTETSPSPGNNDAQHTRAAVVVGGVMIDVTADAGLAALFSGFGGFADSEVDEASITHFQDTQISIP